MKGIIICIDLSKIDYIKHNIIRKMKKVSITNLNGRNYFNLGNSEIYFDHQIRLMYGNYSNYGKPYNVIRNGKEIIPTFYENLKDGDNILFDYLDNSKIENLKDENYKKIQILQKISSCLLLIVICMFICTVVIFICFVKK